MRYLVILFSIFISTITGNWLMAQNTLPANTEVLTLETYLGFVKRFHPVVKQANLQLTAAQAEILQARGGFDPKIEVDYQKKRFKDSEYFDILNSTFKIPTWYGVEIKAAFDKMDGVFLNPENTLPNAGLASLGIQVPIGQGLFINNRMADLRKAKFFANQTKAERDLEVASILYDAMVAYLDWQRAFQEVEVYDFFLKNAEVRFKGIKDLIQAGDRPAIDSVETKIILRNRELSMEQSFLKFRKATLELSNFLWLENDIPLELQDNLVPENTEEQTLINVIIAGDSSLNVNIAQHPKIIAMQNKVDILKVDRRLKGDMLKPRLDLQYNYISEPVLMDQWNTNNYKIGANFTFPLFLRKERGAYKLAKLKVQDAEWQLDVEQLQLKNKIDYQNQEVVSLKKQLRIAYDLVQDNQTMLESEERLFFFGESSIFLINTRENSLINANLQKIRVRFDYLESNAELFKILARVED
ncbi:MAG: TolC family protein [Flavobacterium sp.]